MSKDIKKIICLIVLIVLSLVFIININLSFNMHEFSHCKDEHCTLCVAIEHAKNFIKMFEIVLIICLLKTIFESIIKKVFIVINCIKNTLINNKVQFNE